MSNQVSLTIIAICQMIFALGGLLTAIALIYVLLSFKNMVSRKIDDAMASVQPVMDQAKSIAEQAKETADKVSVKVDAIMSKAETTANSVSEKVSTVSSRVEEAVNPQVATAAGIVGTAMKCYQLYRDLVSVKEAAATSRKSSTPDGSDGCCEP